MGVPTAQVQSPQTSGGKGSPVSDGQLPPAPATSQPQGKGAGGGVGALDPSKYDANVPQRRFANTQDDPMSANVSPAVNRPDLSVNTFPGPNSQQPQGKGGASTNSATSGQPRMGQPNNYTNTVGGWDNASIQPQRSGGKGKGG